MLDVCDADLKLFCDLLQDSVMSCLSANVEKLHGTCQDVVEIVRHSTAAKVTAGTAIETITQGKSAGQMENDMIQNALKAYSSGANIDPNAMMTDMKQLEVIKSTQHGIDTNNITELKDAIVTGKEVGVQQAVEDGAEAVLKEEARKVAADSGLAKAMRNHQPDELKAAIQEGRSAGLDVAVLRNAEFALEVAKGAKAQASTAPGDVVMPLTSPDNSTPSSSWVYFLLRLVLIVVVISNIVSMCMYGTWWTPAMPRFLSKQGLASMAKANNYGTSTTEWGAEKPVNAWSI